ncbi:MAG: penicillin acylase family protein, partial [Candidatus Odinarchaeota archaeon]
KDVVFALGYCHATDRLFQMEMTIRTGMGRMSEIMGSDYIEDDIYYLRLGMNKSAQEMVDTFEQERATNADLDEMLDNLDAYCEGVNSVIKRKIATKTLPIEFQLLNFEPELWTPHKTFVYNKLMGLMLTYSTYDLRASLYLEELFDGNKTAMEELFPVNSTYYQVPVVPVYGNYTWPSKKLSKVAGEQEARQVDRDQETLVSTIKNFLEKTPESVEYFQNSWIGSNNWVANGSKTDTGLPILCNDMHLSIELPSIWYEAHLCAPNDDLNIFGYTLTGTPVVIVGFNTHVAWGFTNVGHDGVDWYEYVWNAGKTQYWSDDENKWKSPLIETVKIPVKGQADHEAEIWYTEDGVILTEDTDGELIAMRWVATVEPTYEILAMAKANKAHNWAEFNESMQYFKDPGQNVVFADDSGNIALRPTGRFIMRTFDEADVGRFVQNGSASYDKSWKYIPYSELPYALNPDQNYLASANQKSAGPDYPYYISSTQSEPYRARAINRLLSEAPDGSIDVEFMMDAQCGGGINDGGILDTRAEAFTPFIVDAVSQSEEATTGKYKDALDALDAWQKSDDKFRMKKELVGPTLYYEAMNWVEYYTWIDEWAEAGFSKDFPQDNLLEYLVKMVPDSVWFDNVSTTGVVEFRDDILVIAFKKAVDKLEDEFGSDVSAWEWGKYHQMDYRHLTRISALGRGQHPHDGSTYTLLAAGGRVVRGGPSERMIVDFSNKSNSWSVLPTGASGIPTSPHYDDQIALWLGKEYHPMFVTYDKAGDFPKDYLEAKLILKPA